MSVFFLFLSSNALRLRTTRSKGKGPTSRVSTKMRWRTTVDGWNPANQLSLIVNPILFTSFYDHPRWLFGISEPSTVSGVATRHPPGNESISFFHLDFPSFLPVCVEYFRLLPKVEVFSCNMFCFFGGILSCQVVAFCYFCPKLPLQLTGNANCFWFRPASRFWVFILNYTNRKLGLSRGLSAADGECEMPVG